MRNFLGALAAFFIGSLLVVLILNPQPHMYPSTVETIWIFLLAGEVFQDTITMLLSFDTLVSTLLIWIVIGVVCGLSSESRWNSVRTVLWLSLFIAVFNLISIFVLDPSIWSSDIANRNILIVLAFVNSVIVSLIGLIGALPVSSLILIYRKESLVQPPEKIETICECGAVFKSNPLICAECGKPLKKESTVI